MLTTILTLGYAYDQAFRIFLANNPNGKWDTCNEDIYNMHIRGASGRGRCYVCGRRDHSLHYISTPRTPPVTFLTVLFVSIFLAFNFITLFEGHQIRFTNMSYLYYTLRGIRRLQGDSFNRQSRALSNISGKCPPLYMILPLWSTTKQFGTALYFVHFLAYSESPNLLPRPSDR